MLLMEAAPVDSPLQHLRGLERRRSSLGLSSLFEHVVPSLGTDPMLEHRASFSMIVDEITGGGGPALSPGTPPDSPGATVPVALGDIDVSMPVVETMDTLAAAFVASEQAGKLGKPAGAGAGADTDAEMFSADEAADDGAGAAVAAVLRPGALDALPALPESRETSPCRSPLPPPSPPPRSAVGVTHWHGTRAAAKAGAAARRPRRRLPDSPAVLAAMPRPPRRPRKSPAAVAASVVGLTPEKARLEKNRVSAKECRARKKEYVANLEAKVIEFEQRDEHRASELADMQRQLDRVQKQYAELLKASASSIVSI